MLKTYTGREFNYKKITKDSIHIPDVLYALPSINRFLGHSSRPYSVGEHTLLGLIVARDLNYTPLQQLHWFIHDFTEAYVGDCPTPLKRLLPEFAVIEKQVELAILDKLGLEILSEEEHSFVKRIDATMLILEMRDLTMHNYEDYMCEDVYEDILGDYDLKDLHTLKYSAEDLREVLTKLFEELIKEVKGDDFKCLEI